MKTKMTQFMRGVETTAKSVVLVGSEVHKRPVQLPAPRRKALNLGDVRDFPDENHARIFQGQSNVGDGAGSQTPERPALRGNRFDFAVVNLVQRGVRAFRQ